MSNLPKVQAVEQIVSELKEYAKKNTINAIATFLSIYSQNPIVVKALGNIGIDNKKDIGLQLSEIPKTKLVCDYISERYQSISKTINNPALSEEFITELIGINEQLFQILVILNCKEGELRVQDSLEIVSQEWLSNLTKKQYLKKLLKWLVITENLEKKPQMKISLSL
jgi:hypothetical protein